MTKTSILSKVVNNGKSVGIQWNYSDRIFKLPSATDYFTAHIVTPVKIRMEEKKSPENYPPILVQTVMRNAISKYGKKSGIIESEQKIKLDSEEYFQQVQITAKGFISLGLSPMHGVGIMVPQNPYWFVSSLGAMFASGLSCRIDPINTAETIKYICQNAPLDLMVVENITLLENLLQKDPSINEQIKNFILLEDGTDSGGMCLDFVEYREKLFTWNEMLHRGKQIDDTVLKEREEEQSVNQACVTGNPKGEMIRQENITWSI